MSKSVSAEQGEGRNLGAWQLGCARSKLDGGMRSSIRGIRGIRGMGNER
jgi:hypothetical protein